MHAQKTFSKKRMTALLTRKAKNSMMHILDLFKTRVSNKAKKASAAASHSTVEHLDGARPMKAPLTRKLTQDEITEAELALKRLQAEKKRLEDLLNCSPDTSCNRHIFSEHSTSSSYSNSCEDVSTNNNVRKEVVRIPRYQQKVAFILHNTFTKEVSS